MYQGQEIPASNRPEAGEGDADRQKCLAAREAISWQSSKESKRGWGQGLALQRTEMYGAGKLGRRGLRALKGQ